MNRRVWTGVAAGVVAAAVLLMVGIGGYRAGQEDEVVTRTLSDGEVVRVVDGGRDFFPGFFLFPLLVIAVVLLATRARRGGWHRPYGPYGSYGPWGDGGPWGGRGPGPCGPDAAMREWHRRMHEDEGMASGGPAGEGTAGEGIGGAEGAPADRPPAQATTPASGPGAGSPPAP
jgi:hypothetical protein